jgi:hypothetical protein
LIVGESKSGVVESPLFDDDELLGVIECLDVHLSNIVEEVLVIDGSNLLSFEIDDVDMGVGDIHNDHLSLVEHGEEVYNIGIFMLKENFACRINMNYTLISSRIDDLGENESIVECGGEA